MRLRTALLGVAGLLFVLAPAVAHAKGVPAPSEIVPLNDWAYDAAQYLEQGGIFVWDPDRRHPVGVWRLTRFEFAAALKQGLGEFDRKIEAVSFSDVNPNRSRLRRDVATFRKLAEEFHFELAMLGTDVGRLKEDLERLADRLGPIDYLHQQLPTIPSAGHTWLRLNDAGDLYYSARSTHPSSPNVRCLLLYQLLDIHSGSVLRLPGSTFPKSQPAPKERWHAPSGFQESPG